MEKVRLKSWIKYNIVLNKHLKVIANILQIKNKVFISNNCVCFQTD